MSAPPGHRSDGTAIDRQFAGRPEQLQIDVIVACDRRRQGAAPAAAGAGRQGVTGAVRVVNEGIGDRGGGCGVAPRQLSDCISGDRHARHVIAHGKPEPGAPAHGHERLPRANFARGAPVGLLDPVDDRKGL